MHRSRSKEITNVIVTKAGLVSIYNLLLRKAEASSKGHQLPEISVRHNRPKVSVVSANSMSTTDDSERIFDDDVLDYQKTESIQMSYRPIHVEQSINVSLREIAPDDHRTCTFSVSGDDPIWVDGTFAEMERLVGGFPPRRGLAQLWAPWRVIVRALIAFAIGYSYVNFMLLFPSSSSATPAPAWVQYVASSPALRNMLFFAFCELVGWFPAGWFLSWVEKLWPSVEFDFGPEHHKARKEQRRRIAWLLVVILLPLMIEGFKKFVLLW